MQCRHFCFRQVLVSVVVKVKKTHERSTKNNKTASFLILSPNWPKILLDFERYTKANRSKKCMRLTGTL
jgi:hypothetical protein